MDTVYDSEEYKALLAEVADLRRQLESWQTVTDYARGHGTEGSGPGDLQALIQDLLSDKDALNEETMILHGQLIELEQQLATLRAMHERLKVDADNRIRHLEEENDMMLKSGTELRRQLEAVSARPGRKSRDY